MNQSEQLPVATAYCKQAIALKKNSNYPEAMKSYQKAAEIYRQLSLWKDYINTRNEIDRYSLEYQANEATYQQIMATLDVAKEKLGEKHAHLAQTYLNLGLYFIYVSDEEQAFLYLNKGIAINKQLFGEKHPVTAKFYDAIGNAHNLKRSYNKALSYREKALIIRLQLFGENHEDVAHSYANMGVCHWHKGEYQNTLDYTKRALEIQKKVSGHFHPDVATTYNNLGRCYETLEQLPKALKAYQESLHINKKILDKEHHNFSRILKNLGNCFFKMHHYQKSLNCYLQTLPFITSSETKNDLIARTHTQIAASFLALKDIPTALSHLEKATKLYQKKTPQTVDDRVGYDNSMAYAALLQHQYPTAFEHLQKSLTLCKEKQKAFKNKDNMITTYLGLSHYHQQMDEKEAALAYLEEALMLPKQFHPKKPRLMAMIYQALGNYYLQEKEVEQAKSYLNKARTIFQKVFESEEHPTIVAIGEVLKGME